MRLKLSLLCLLPLLLVACSTVRVTEVKPRNDQPADTGQQQPTRADRAGTDAFPAADGDGYRPPERLAVLLPMSGSLAPAAATVRDGFLAAYYAETRRRPTVRFYDSLGTASGAQLAAAKALSDGAQMIVGPLAREEVNGLASQQLAVPVVSLNRGSAAPAAGSISFALSPEDEGVAAAKRLLSRGLRTVLVLSNRSDGAQRTIAALRSGLVAGQGGISADVAVARETPEISAQLSALQAGPMPPQAVFLAMDAGQARAIMAQLKVSPLAGLPRMATSQVTSGASARSDIELDGLEYPELPWLLGAGSNLPNADTLSKSLPGARGAAQRLFAFGADAWKLVGYFERLYNDPAATLRGATGELRIAVDGNVLRDTSWAVFIGGQGRASQDTPRPSDARPTP